MKGVLHTPRGHWMHTVCLWNTCFIYWWKCIIFITVFINLNRSASMYALQVSFWNDSRGCCILHYLNLLYFCLGLFVVFHELFLHLSSVVFTFFSRGDIHLLLLIWKRVISSANSKSSIKIKALCLTVLTVHCYLLFSVKHGWTHLALRRETGDSSFNTSQGIVVK